MNNPRRSKRIKAINFPLVKSIISKPHNGGITSISHAPFGSIQHARMPPSSINNSSSPGGNGFGYSISPDFNRTRQVPQFPEVQLVGISTPALSAISTIGSSSVISAEPINNSPRKNRTMPTRWREAFDSSIAAST